MRINLCLEIGRFSLNIGSRFFNWSTVIEPTIIPIPYIFRTGYNFQCLVTYNISFECHNNLMKWAGKGSFLCFKMRRQLQKSWWLYQVAQLEIQLPAQCWELNFISRGSCKMYNLVRDRKLRYMKLLRTELYHQWIGKAENGEIWGSRFRSGRGSQRK